MHNITYSLYKSQLTIDLIKFLSDCELDFSVKYYRDDLVRITINIMMLEEEYFNKIMFRRFSFLKLEENL